MLISMIDRIDSRGRQRIGELVTAVMRWQGLTGVELGNAGRISRATLYRVKGGDVVASTTLYQLGDALGLPRDYLLYVGRGDVRKIEASGGDPDLIRWTVDLIQGEQGGQQGLSSV